MTFPIRYSCHLGLFVSVYVCWVFGAHGQHFKTYIGFSFVCAPSYLADAYTNKQTSERKREIEKETKRGKRRERKLFANWGKNPLKCMCFFFQFVRSLNIVPYLRNNHSLYTKLNNTFLDVLRLRTWPAFLCIPHQSNSPQQRERKKRKCTVYCSAARASDIVYIYNIFTT